MARILVIQNEVSYSGDSEPCLDVEFICLDVEFIWE